MIKFGPNRYNAKDDAFDPPFERIIGNRGIMFHVDEHQATIARNTQKIMQNKSGRLLEIKDIQGFIQHTIHRIDRVFHQVDNANMEELQYMRLTLEELQHQKSNEMMLDELERIHIRITDIETQMNI